MGRGVTLQRMGAYLELTRGQCLSLMLLVAGTVGDILTTGIESAFFHTREANPFSIAMINNLGLFGYLFVKLVVVVSATVFLLRLVNRVLTRYPKRGGHQTIADLTILVSGGGGIVLLGVTALNVWEAIYAWQRLHGG